MWRHNRIYECCLVCPLLELGDPYEEEYSTGPTPDGRGSERVKFECRECVHAPVCRYVSGEVPIGWRSDSDPRRPMS